MIGRKLPGELASSDRITDVASQISQHLLASPRGDLHPSVDGRVSVSSCGWVLQQTDRAGACADLLAYSTRWNARFLTDGSAS